MKDEHILAVARYLEGDMEMPEMIAFETQIRESEELKQAIEEYKRIHQSLKMNIAPDEQDRQLVSSLAVLNKQYFQEERATKPPKQAKVFSIKPYLKYISIAAVLVIGLLVWAPWSSGLYEKYAISRQMSVAERGADSQNNITKGAELFNKGKYEAARKLLQAEYMLNPQNPLLSYYFAITLVETGKEYEARTIFMNLYKGESVFKYDAAYYVALSFIKEKNKPAAIEWLQKIPEGTANSNKSKELISALR